MAAAAAAPALASYAPVIFPLGPAAAPGRYTLVHALGRSPLGRHFAVLDSVAPCARGLRLLTVSLAAAPAAAVAAAQAVAAAADAEARAALDRGAAAVSEDPAVAAAARAESPSLLPEALARPECAFSLPDGRLCTALREGSWPWLNPEHTLDYAVRHAAGDESSGLMRFLFPELAAHRRLPPERRLRPLTVAWQLRGYIAALRHLHETLGVVHGGLSRVACIDLGMRRLAFVGHAAAGGGDVATSDWWDVAPEVAAGGTATPASDVYGLGSLAYSLLAQTTPGAVRARGGDLLAHLREACASWDVARGDPHLASEIAAGVIVERAPDASMPRFPSFVAAAAAACAGSCASTAAGGSPGAPSDIATEKASRRTRLDAWLHDYCSLVAAATAAAPSDRQTLAELESRVVALEAAAEVPVTVTVAAPAMDARMEVIVAQDVPCSSSCFDLQRMCRTRFLRPTFLSLRESAALSLVREGASTITVHLRGPQSARLLPITIERMEGAPISMEVEAEDLVEELKLAIEEHVPCLHPYVQRLIIGLAAGGMAVVAPEMANGRTLGSYGVTRGTVLWLAKRLRGD